jgi:hypothetical protein
MTLTADEITSKNYDLLMGQLCPWGPLDVWNMIKTAEEVGLNMYELAEILQNQANELCINLFDTEHTTDVNALLNDYILQQARNEIDDLLKIDICNDYDVYFFANYLDCPLQYSNECQEAIEQAIKDNELTREDFNDYTLYVLDAMNINFSTNEDEE